ncbi:MAG: daunorubicin/doxorubicin resistance ABC transporter ATP-binding protein DrrA, partial [Acidimicrobiia bacterium]|nr:daunorubicin/doxorubicin resistance ABC transporter ATP-binding protein DrrA [Acidimicrobiia bacterium]
LDHNAIEPESLAVREPTLDDVFLQLTGDPTEISAIEDDDEEGAA